MPPINGVTTTASHSIATHGVDTGATTRIGQATSANVSFHEGPSSHQRQGVIYAPFASKDILIQALGHNQHREQVGKPLHPVICRNEQDKADVEQYRQSEISHLSQIVQSVQATLKQTMAETSLTRDQLRQQIGPPVFDKMMANCNRLETQIDILTRMKITGNDALATLSPTQHKIYVIGHGGAGMNILAADAECQQGVVTAKEVAHQLAEGGLDKRFTDIRVLACWSADTREPTSFQQKALAKAAKAQTQHSGFLGKFLGLFGKNKVVAEPFAQTLSNELKKEGFELPRVSGYHGAGVTYSTEHYIRRLPDSQESDARASTVRQFFIPV